MVRVQLIGAAALAQLMRAEEAGDPELSWLLHGPSDEGVVQAEESPPPRWLLAAE